MDVQKAGRQLRAPSPASDAADRLDTDWRMAALSVRSSASPRPRACGGIYP